MNKNRIVLSLGLYTSKASYLLTTLSSSPSVYCPKAHFRRRASRGQFRSTTSPYALYPCLLLKPISTHYANCPISSPCRPTRASVLSSHIEGLITSLSVLVQWPPLYAAPHGYEPLRATLPDLSSPQGRPRLAGVANYTPLARQRIATFPLPLTKAMFCIPTSYLLS